MTEKIFYSDPHITEFTACVLSCEASKDGFLVELDRSAFFPEEGGQGADTGFINDLPVKHVSIKKDVLYHLLPAALEVGSRVTGRVNYEQRFDYMQQHSGEHILSGLAHSLYGCTNVGFHLGATETTLDFDKPLSPEELAVLEAKANEAILKNLPISCSFPEPEVLKTLDYRSKLDLTENVRIVEIPGIDICACCAPHVDSTGQICLLKIVKREAWKGGVRLTIYCGKRALKNYSESLQILDSLTKLTSAAAANLPATVQKIKDEAACLKAANNNLEAELLSLKIAAYAPEDLTAPLLYFGAPVDSRTVRNTLNEIYQKREGLCGIFTGSDENGYNFILARSTGGLSELMQSLRKDLSAKCGGDDKMLQGNINLCKEEIIKYLS